MKNGPAACAGVTLVELMFGLAIFAILVGIGAPSFASLVRDSRVTSLTNGLVGTFALARSEAMKRGLPVSVCASADAERCTPDADWSDGWLTFTDDAGVVGAIDGTDVLLQVGREGSNAWSGYVVAANVTYLRFAPNGLTDSDVPASSMRTFTLKKAGCTGRHARRVEVSRIGRVATTRVDC